MRVPMTLRYLLDENPDREYFSGREIFDAARPALERYGARVRHPECYYYERQLESPSAERRAVAHRMLEPGYLWEPWFYPSLCYAHLYNSTNRARPKTQRVKIDGLWHYTLTEKGLNWCQIKLID